MINYIQTSARLAPTALPGNPIPTAIGPDYHPYDRHDHILHVVVENITGPTEVLIDVEIEIFAYMKMSDAPMLIAKFNVNSDRGRCDVPCPVFAAGSKHLYVRQASDMNPVAPAGGAVANAAVNYQLYSLGQGVNG